jgi:hypothetical protein
MAMTRTVNAFVKLLRDNCTLILHSIRILYIHLYYLEPKEERGTDTTMETIIT